MVDINEDLTCGSFEPFLKKSLSKHKEVPAGCILQIQHINNISVAKQDGRQNYEPEKHILKVTLTDGEGFVYALVTEPINRLNLNTPPGTKMKFLSNAPAHGHLVLLSRTNVQILGGDVPKLIEKWEFQRKLDIKKDWGATGIIEGSEGPPLWRPFGHKAVPIDLAVLRSMKAMDIVNEKKEGTVEVKSTEFDQQRNEAISELADKSVKQKWQKPNKHLVDKEVQDIMDEGFSFEEASNALNRFKNQQKALRFLKADKGELPVQRSFPPEERKKRRNGKGMDDEDDTAPIPREYQRPTNNISLFGFIADTINIKGAETDPISSENCPPEAIYGTGSDYHLTRDHMMNRRRARGDSTDFRPRRGRGRGRGFSGRNFEFFQEDSEPTGPVRKIDRSRITRPRMTSAELTEPDRGLVRPGGYQEPKKPEARWSDSEQNDSVFSSSDRWGSGPNQPREHNRFGSGPNQPREHNRFGSGPNQPREHNRFGSGPADQPRENNRFGSGPNQPREHDRFGSGPNQPREHDRFGSGPDQQRENNRYDSGRGSDRRGGRRGFGRGMGRGQLFRDY